MRRKLPLQPAGLALVASMLLALLLWASNRSWQSLIEAEAWVKHTHEIQLATERLRSVLVDAETGQRGFLVTGNESYLTPYRQALGRYRAALAEVRQLAAYSPVQQRRVERLEPLVETKMEELARTIQLRQQVGLEAAQIVVRTDLGRRTMDEVRDVLQEVNQEEQRLLGGLAAQAQHRGHQLRLFILSTCVSLALVGGAAWAGYRRQVLTEAALRESEASFRRLTENIPDLVSRIDPRRRIVYANPAACHAMGRGPDDLLGRTPRELGIPSEVLARCEATLDRAFAGEDVEMLIPIHASGGERCIQTRFVPERDARGQVGSVLSLSRDVTGFTRWDGDRLAQVRTNLLCNALAYSPPDTPVQVEVRGGGGDPVLSIHNAGEPIPPEQRSRLFEPMQRGPFSKDRSSRSIGLGLFIVRHVVMAHGGLVDVESSRDEGTTFLVRLPRA
ncbi:CHASE3 domain-containing protein [Archangium violaceum]|uniref:CHASE3 domain-containing protein n=1 Tax=Archangium violaceum TaxID=83451 RepID=UPI00193C3DC9|nr:CHASE3 domain-containing protein [Archangium violaceum]QRK06259.1 CHASE3 domain-containing protein [Archangium violaceum]